jgi:hypothetical protein
MNEKVSNCPRCGATLDPGQRDERGALTCAECGARLSPEGRPADQDGPELFGSEQGPTGAFALDTDEDYAEPGAEPARTGTSVDVFEIQDTPTLKRLLIDEYRRSRSGAAPRPRGRLLLIALAAALAAGACLAAALLL